METSTELLSEDESEEEELDQLLAFGDENTNDEIPDETNADLHKNVREALVRLYGEHEAKSYIDSGELIGNWKSCNPWKAMKRFIKAYDTFIYNRNPETRRDYKHSLTLLVQALRKTTKKGMSGKQILDKVYSESELEPFYTLIRTLASE